MAFVFLAGGDTEAKVNQYMAVNRFTWPNGLDQGDRIARAYGVRGYPTTIFIDKQGKEKSRRVGAMDQAGYAAAIKQIL